MALFAPHARGRRRFQWKARGSTRSAATIGIFARRDAVDKSVAYFERVIAIDPRDPRGYAALASANAIVADYNYGPAPIEVYIARARAYAREALAIDPNCGEAYAVLGMIASKKWYGVPARPGGSAEPICAARSRSTPRVGRPTNGTASRCWSSIASTRLPPS